MTGGAGWRYGLLGLPLAFAALPLYVHLPAYYALEFGMPLAVLGALLLGARLLDALLDPWIGAWVDRLLARSASAVLALGGGCAVLLALGLAMLFFPPVRGHAPLLAWAAGALALTYVAFSTLTVAHQAWGAALGGDEAQRARIVAWREGLGLAGVVLASLLPAWAGWPATLAVLAVALAAGCWAWHATRRPPLREAVHFSSRWAPFAHAGFRHLLAAFALNGVASAIPATLLLFFVRDRLQAPAALEPAFLATYFVAAALSMPAWLRLVRRWGLARSWLAGMVLAVAAFVGAAALGPGDARAFLVVCALSGLALGSDLALPGALLAGVIDRAGQRGRAEGLFFGWWNLVAKLNLALAAGLALPLLAWAGYAPGNRSPQALQALAITYCLLPCALKLAAAAVLYLTTIRPGGFR